MLILFFNLCRSKTLNEKGEQNYHNVELVSSSSIKTGFLVHKLFTIMLNVVVDSNQTEHCVETENKTKDSSQAEPGINGLSFIINDLK